MDGAQAHRQGSTAPACIAGNRALGGGESVHFPTPNPPDALACLLSPSLSLHLVCPQKATRSRKKAKASSAGWEKALASLGQLRCYFRSRHLSPLLDCAGVPSVLRPRRKHRMRVPMHSAATRKNHERMSRSWGAHLRDFHISAGPAACE
jgi:hypothetical protein